MQFSIVIPTLNEEKFLPRLLASLVTQTEKDFEVIVVDGLSKDKTVVRAQEFSNKLPHLSIITTPSGVSAQRNAGAKAASGKWLIFLDADGAVVPNFIERMAKFIAKARPSFFSAWVMPDSDVSGDAIITLLANLSLEASITLKHQFAPGLLTIVRKEIFFSVGGYDESISFAEDYDLSRRLYEHGIKLQIFRETLCIYSLRRFRREGRMRSLQTHALAMLSAFIVKVPIKMRGYPMGGQIYTDDKKSINPSALKKFQSKLRLLTKELFD